VLDLAGLIDPHIARTLRARNREGFYDYVFEDRKPDLVWIHSYWKEAIKLETDPRLARDYETLVEDASHTLYVRSTRSEGLGLERLAAAFHERR
jgi:hypothetical protein